VGLFSLKVRAGVRKSGPATAGPDRLLPGQGLKIRQFIASFLEKVAFYLTLLTHIKVLSSAICQV